MAASKQAILSLLVGLGLIFLLMGLLGDIISLSSGITALFVLWVGAAVVALFWVPKKKKRK